MIINNHKIAHDSRNWADMVLEKGMPCLVSLSLLLGVIVSMLLLPGCATQQVKDVVIPVWPAPPLPPRYIYEGTLRTKGSISSGEKEFKELEKLDFIQTSDEDGFFKPFDVAAYGGKIVVSDTVARIIHVIDVPHRQLYRIGWRGNGKLTKPIGVAMDAQQRIYVADVTGKRIVVYDEAGHFKTALGGDLVRPTDVAVNSDGTRIYVVDNGGIESLQHRVIVYNEKGKQLLAIGGRGNGPGQFNLPVQAAVGPDGTLYVLDAGNFRVQVFDSAGNYLRHWGQAGRNLGDLARPRGIAVDQDGHVYVTDTAFANFQVYDTQGQLLLPVGNVGNEDGPGNLVLPAGIAVDETNRVYVVDQLFKKVEVIRKLSEEEVNAGQNVSENR